jgi:hypothetical protein
VAGDHAGDLVASSRPALGGPLFGLPHPDSFCGIAEDAVGPHQEQDFQNDLMHDNSLLTVLGVLSEHLLSQPASVVPHAKLWCAIPVSQPQIYSASRGCDSIEGAPTVALRINFPTLKQRS